MREIVRVLKPGGPLSLYLYEDHGGNPWKALPLRAVSALRRVTTKLPPLVLSCLCYALSPVVVLVFSIPARIMARFGPTRALAEQMPFNFGTGPFSVHADSMDRLGAPIEVRYSREGFASLMRDSGLGALRVTQLARSAGWVGREDGVNGVRCWGTLRNPRLRAGACPPPAVRRFRAPRRGGAA